MKVDFYLTVNRNGTIRTTKGRPGLAWDEVSVKMQLELPHELFQRPALQATVVIPQEAAVTKPLTAEVINNVEDAIKTATALDFKVRVIEESSDEDDMSKMRK